MDPLVEPHFRKREPESSVFRFNLQTLDLDLVSDQASDQASVQALLHAQEVNLEDQVEDMDMGDQAADVDEADQVRSRTRRNCNNCGQLIHCRSSHLVERKTNRPEGGPVALRSSRLYPVRCLDPFKVQGYCDNCDRQTFTAKDLMPKDEEALIQINQDEDISSQIP